MQNQSAKHFMLNEAEVEIVTKALFVAHQHLLPSTQEAMELQEDIDYIWVKIVKYRSLSHDELDRWVVDNIGFDVHEASNVKITSGKRVIGNGLDEEGGFDDENRDYNEDGGLDDEDDMPSRSIH